MSHRRHHPDELFQFSYRIFKIEYVIIKLLLFALSLYGLYKIAKEEFGFNFPATRPRGDSVSGRRYARSDDEAEHVSVMPEINE